MILDNGAFETGEAVPNNQYIELVEELKPDVVVIPDVLFNPSATLDRFFIFMQDWKGAHVKHNCGLMGVIQANGSLEMAHMMGILYNSHGIQVIGVPYASKLDRYYLISQHPEWDNIHILGCPTLPEAISLGTLPNVRSIDSSLPVKATKSGMRINDSIFAHSHVHPSDDSLDFELLKYNLDIFTSTCKGECRIVMK